MALVVADRDVYEAVGEQIKPSFDGTFRHAAFGGECTTEVVDRLIEMELKSWFESGENTPLYGSVSIAAPKSWIQHGRVGEERPSLVEETANVIELNSIDVE